MTGGRRKNMKSNPLSFSGQCNPDGNTEKKEKNRKTSPTNDFAGQRITGGDYSYIIFGLEKVTCKQTNQPGIRPGRA